MATCSLFLKLNSCPVIFRFSLVQIVVYTTNLVILGHKQKNNFPAGEQNILKLSIYVSVHLESRTAEI